MKHIGKQRLILRFAIVLVLLIGCCFVFFFLQRRGTHNVLLITMDTTRANAIGCFDSLQFAAHTPNIDALAREGTIFTRAYSQCEQTIPSHQSLFESRYVFETIEGHANPDPDICDIPSILRRAGFISAAFHSVNILDPEFFRSLRNFDFYAPLGDTFERRGGETAQRVIHWLYANGSRSRWFLWVHFFDPHYPYEPPPPFEGSALAETDPKLQQYKRYLGEVSYMDSCIGQILATLQTLGLTKKTLFILTADHGEGFGEHGIFASHMTLYDEMIRVPLIFACPGRLPGGLRSTALVSNVDILPTIMEILRIKGDEGTNFAGRSLLPFLKGDGDPAPRYIFSESHLFSSQTSPQESAGISSASLISERWKYIEYYRDIHLESPLFFTSFHVLKGTKNLYDIFSDPAELKDIASGEIAVVKDLSGKVEEIYSARAAAHAPPVLDPELRERLKALGY